MLSDHELKMLRELERRLLDDDPDYPRRFDARARRLGRPLSGWPARTAIAALAVLGAVLVAAGAPGVALGLVVAVGLLWLAWRWMSVPPSDGGPPHD